MREYRKAYSQYYMVMETKGVVTSIDPEWKRFHKVQSKLDTFMMTHLCLTLVLGTDITTASVDGKGGPDG